MKYALIICFAAVAGLLALSAVRLLRESSEPFGRIIPDMAVDATRYVSVAPPPGVVPHDSSPTLQRAAVAPETLFERHCAACHGKRGDGCSYVAAQPGMPEVNDLTTSAVTPDEMFQTLTEGRGAMPAHKTRLSDSERRSLILYIRTHLHQQ